MIANLPAEALNVASKMSNLGLQTSKMTFQTDENTAIFEGAAVIAAGILNKTIYGHKQNCT